MKTKEELEIDQGVAKRHSGEWLYDKKFDAYYDAKTFECMESKCDDPTCRFNCVNRPAKFIPSGA